MNEEQLKDVKSLFMLYPEIKVVYFFSSRAVGKGGPLSDYDFAIYLDEKNRREFLYIKFKLLDHLK
jgi:Nucleotidyltransferase domain.